MFERKKKPGTRAVVTEAFCKMAEAIAAHEETKFEQVMSAAILPFADAVGFDRLGVYRLTDTGRDNRFEQMYSWDREYGGTSKVKDVLNAVPINRATERWYKILESGKFINSRRRDMADHEKDIVGPFNILGLMIVPVFFKQMLWGVVTLQDHTYDRAFDESCSDMIIAGARVCADAVVKDELISDSEGGINVLKRNKRMSDALNESALIFLQQSERTFAGVMSQGVKLIMDACELDKMSVWRNYMLGDGLHTRQIYRWDRASGGAMGALPGLEDIVYQKLIPTWERKLGAGQCINGPSSEFSESEPLRSYGCLSIFVAPIVFGRMFWGFVLYEDVRINRYFEKNASDVMLRAGLLIANAIIRSEMERELSEVGDFNRSLLDAAPISFTVIDEHLNIIDCNNRALQVFECERQYYFAHFFELSPEYQPDGALSREKAREHIKTALNEGTTSFEWIHQSKSGEIIPAELTLTAVKYKGRPMILAFLYDLRNIKKMEREIAESEEITRAVTDASPMAYIMFNDDFQPFECNNAALSLFNCPNKETFFEKYHGLSPELQPNGERSADYIPQIAKLVLKEGYRRIEWVHQTLDGEPLPVEISITRINYLGKMVLVSFMYDLRNIKKMDEDLRRQSKKLQDALKYATTASKAKGEFLSNMSHEMRTPLNAIIGMTSIGKAAEDIERKDYALKRIEDASQHLLGVINDVLDMSKIEANKLELSPVEFSFDKMLQKVLTVINFRADEKHQKLDVRVAPDMPRFLFCDDQRLAQVITNLLSNAVKFTPENGKIKLEAKLQKENDDMCTILVEVEDTGIGIAKSDQDKLFVAFGQGESDTSRKFGGTGLGLTISKRIVDLMGGAIWVDSEPGKGSKFSFTIQAKRGKKPPRALLDSAIDWETMRVLVVDDDADVLTNFSNMFKRIEIKCDTAISAQDAIDLITKNGNYDLYFVDWQMPGTDGIVLTDKIKRELSEGSAVVVMISSVDWTHIRTQALGVGVDKYLLKPILLSGLVDCLNECLGADAIKPPPPLGLQASNERLVYETKPQQIIPPAPAPVPSESSQKADFDVNVLRGKHVLLAEDIEINREVIVSLLEDTGILIDTAEDGEQTVNMVKAEPDKYDAVLMDVQMPKMDGLEATKEIRAFINRRLPIIAMTANVFKEDVEECTKAGMDDHIGKPIDIGELIRKLAKHL